MPTLDRETLNEACRAIYNLAGETCILPPLTRDSELPGAQSSNVYNFRAGRLRVDFVVCLDETFVAGHALPYSRLPLKFHIEIFDESYKNNVVELGGHDKNELVRAFLLGVNIPISVDQTHPDAPLRVSIQLSPTYSFECGQLSDSFDDCTAIDICNRVADAVYARSEDFFECQQDGIAVWRMHAGHQLFDEARPAAETYWPAVRLKLIVSSFEHEVTKYVEHKPRFSRYAIAASIMLGLFAPAALTMIFLFRGNQTNPVQMAQTDISPAKESADLRQSSQKDTQGPSALAQPFFAPREQTTRLDPAPPPVQQTDAANDSLPRVSEAVEFAAAPEITVTPAPALAEIYAQPVESKVPMLASMKLAGIGMLTELVTSGPAANSFRNGIVPLPPMRPQLKRLAKRTAPEPLFSVQKTVVAIKDVMKNLEKSIEKIPAHIAALIKA